LIFVAGRQVVAEEGWLLTLNREITQTEIGDDHFGNLPHPEFELPGRVNGPRRPAGAPPRKNEP